jgi:hypothetical protein
MKKLCYISILVVLISSGFAIQNTTTDFVQNTTPVELSKNVRRLNYQIVWSLTINHIAALGVTPVWDTMLWVSSGGRTGSTDPNWMLIYNLNTMTLVDSFLQGTPETWGYRDMCFYSGYVYAGYEGYVNKIDPVTHTVVGHYAVSTPNPVRALMDNDVEDSLWSATFTAPIYKFWNQGGTSRQVAPAVWALYGLAYDAHGYVWGSAQNPMSTLVKYSYPTFTTLDTATITEITNPLGDSAIAGGCEMWRDSFLLYLGQAKPLDKVYCIKPTPPPANDVGLDAILYPTGTHRLNTQMIPMARVKNYGTSAQTSFEVICSIVGTGGNVRYTNIKPVSSLAAGDTVRVSFDAWTPSVAEVESVIMRTTLTGDQNPGNNRKFNLTVIAQYVQDFEADNGGYVPNPATGAWEWGTPTYVSGPASAFSGTKCWGTVLAGPYTLSANWKLNSCKYTATANNPVLGFMHWYMIETSYDGGNVKYSTDTITWTLLHPTVDPYNHVGYTGTGIVGESCWSSSTAINWHAAAVTIPVNSGQSFWVRWHFASDPSVQYAGWYIDDVSGAGFQSGIAEENTNTILKTALYASKPNPVINGLAKISFNLSKPSKVNLTIYDASGRVIKTLVNTKLEQGVYTYNWNGKDDADRNIAEGIYFYTLKTDNQNFTKKLIYTR